MGRLFNSFVQKVTDAATIEDFCAALEKCRETLESGSVNRESFMECLRKRLSDMLVCLEGSRRLKGFPGSAVRVYKDTAACLAYLAFKVDCCREASQLPGQLDDLLSLLWRRTTEPKTAMLDEAEISCLLELLQNKYNYVSMLTYEKRLEIYLVNRSHVCFDSWLMTFKNTYTGKWINQWMVMSFAPTRDIPLCGRQFVFLHEMGHILYNEMTEGGLSVPPLFTELMDLISGMSPASGNYMLPELFSDLFAASAMNGSRYEGLNPYAAILPKALMTLLEEYFHLLIAKVGSGYYGTERKLILH